MKYFHALTCFTSLLLMAPVSVLAHDTTGRHSHSYSKPLRHHSAPTVIYAVPGSVIYTVPAYSSPYSGYGHGYYQHKHNQIKRPLPSTHIYGAYPYRKHNSIRLNPHSSSLQKKYYYGGKTPGYNHYSRRGHGSWYRY